MKVELVGGIVDGLIVEVDSLVLAIFIPQLTGSGLVKYRYTLTDKLSANSFPIYEYSDFSYQARTKE